MWKFFRHLTLHPLYDGFGDGGGGAPSGTGGGGAGTGGAASGAGGSGAGASAGAGSGAGGGTGAGAGAGSGGGASAGPFEFTDTSQIRMSDGRVITGAQYRQEIETGLRTDYDGRYQKGYQMLLAEAKRLDQMGRGNGQGQGNGQGNRQADPFAEIAGMPVASGEAVAKLAQMLRDQGLAPIAKMVQDQARQIATMQQEYRGMQGHVGSQNEERAAQDFENRLTTTLGSIEVKGLNGPVDAQDPGIREFARNLFLSYNPTTWKAGEFEKMLGDQLSGIVAAVRKLDQTHVQTSRDKVRQNFNPNRGSGSPRGGAAYKFQSGREIAQLARDAGMFNGSGNQT